MSEQTPPAEPETPPAAPQEPEVPNDRPPENVLKEAMRRAAAAEAEAAELRKWREDQEQAQMSELERATKAREEAEQRATQAEQRATELERSGYIREAARAAGFADPTDAVAFLSSKLSEITDAAAAKTAVEQLAESKKHLLASSDTPQRPAPIGGLTPSTPAGEIPTGPDGKPDLKAGLGRDLLSGLLGR